MKSDKRNVLEEEDALEAAGEGCVHSKERQTGRSHQRKHKVGQNMNASKDESKL